MQKINIKWRIKSTLQAGLSVLFCLCPIKKNKIVLESFGGTNYSDNPKMIVEEAIAEHKPWDIVWLSVEKPNDLPEPVRWVEYGSNKALYEWGTARVWVDNVRQQFRPIKRKGQYYIQTWHASFSLKLIEKDCEDKLDKNYVKAAQKDGQRTDAIVSNSKLLDDVYKRAFWLQDRAELWQTGLPRNDTLFQHQDDKGFVEKVRRFFGIDQDQYVVLYAPTFRDDRSTGGYLNDFDKIIEAFERKYAKKCRLLVRMHPNVSKHSLGFHYNDNIINASDYPDVQELAIATDCVISDYSTIVFDYMLLRKPVFLCALDLDHYNALRGVFPIIYDLPCALSQSTQELIHSIESYDQDDYLKKLDEFHNNYPVYDKGDAAKQIVSKIQSIIG